MRCMIFCFTFMSMVLFASCSHTTSSKQEDAQKLFAECAGKAFAESRWLSFDVDDYRFKYADESGYLDSIFVFITPRVSYFNDKNNPEYYMNYVPTTTYKLRGDTLYYVNTQDNELGVFEKCAKNYSAYGNHKFTNEKRVGYVTNYYTAVFPSLSPTEKLKIENYTDTLVDNVPYYLFKGFTSIVLTSGGSLGDREVVTRCRCLFWVNKETYQLDSLVAYKEDTLSLSIIDKEAYALKNFSYEDKSAYFDSVFNFSNPLYEKYSRHDDRFIPYSMGGQNPKFEAKTLMDFPLVNLDNDTVTIVDYIGWTLLNFWSFNCPSCIKNLQNYGHEKDSLGYRILENEGIKILAINYYSDNMELIKQMGDKTGTTDIMYSAKGIRTLISTPYLGYYYLLSPEKEVVYESYTLGDYSELLKAKQEYEKTHLNK